MSEPLVVMIERRASGWMAFELGGKQTFMTASLRKHSTPRRKWRRHFWTVTYEVNGRTVIVENVVKKHRKAVNAYMRLVKKYELKEERWKV